MAFMSSQTKTEHADVQPRQNIGPSSSQECENQLKWGHFSNTLDNKLLQSRNCYNSCVILALNIAYTAITLSYIIDCGIYHMQNGQNSIRLGSEGTVHKHTYLTSVSGTKTNKKLFIFLDCAIWANSNK
jgi:hypothetical protein